MQKRSIKNRKMPEGVFSKIIEEEDLIFFKSEQRGVVGDLQRAEREKLEYKRSHYLSICEEIKTYENDSHIKENRERFEINYDGDFNRKVYNKLSYYKGLLAAKEQLEKELGIEE